MFLPGNEGGYFMDALYILIGLLFGGVIGFLLSRWKIAVTHVRRKIADDLQQQVRKLEQDNITRLSKEEVSRDFVSKSLAQHYLENIRQLQERLKDEEWAVRQQQTEIIRLTRESEQRVLKADVDEKDQLILQLNNELTARKEKEHALNEKLELFNKELHRLHEFSQERFRTLATEVLEEKKRTFVDVNKKEIATILDPLKTELHHFKEKVDATRKEDIQDLTSLKKEIELLQTLNLRLSDDARNLATALKSEVKVQGNWGEERLNLLLESEGLQQYIDYSREEVYLHAEDERNRRPDFILKLPENKHIIIDSKVSLTAYVNYFNAVDADGKQHYLKQHVKSVTSHIDKLAAKNYQTLSGLNTPDYVFLFMPVEGALTLALNQHPDLFNHALKKNIVLIAPTTLVATLKVVRLIWQKENQVKNVEEIFRQCGELYNKFVLFLEEMDRMEHALNQAGKAHRDAMNHLKDGGKKGNTIIGRFEKIKSLEAKTNKQIPDKYLTGLEQFPGDME